MRRDTGGGTTAGGEDGRIILQWDYSSRIRDGGSSRWLSVDGRLWTRQELSRQAGRLIHSSSGGHQNLRVLVWMGSDSPGEEMKEVHQRQPPELLLGFPQVPACSGSETFQFFPFPSSLSFHL